MEVLKAVPRVGPYVIAGADPQESYADLGRPWGKVRERAGLPDVRLHDLRHTFASMAAAKGLSLPMIGKLLGHTVPATTQRYAHLALDPISDLNEGIGEALTNAMTAKKPSPTGRKRRQST
jgi:integrase